MKSILGKDAEEANEESKKGRRDESRLVPGSLKEMRSKIRQSLQQRLSGTEWRALGVETVGGPMAQVRRVFRSELGEPFAKPLNADADTAPTPSDTP
jgi:hypothetical protein